MIYFGSTGRHINRNIHHHYGYSIQGGWFVWGGGTGTYDCRGTFGSEFIGGKYWNREADEYVEVARAVIHFRAGFSVPPANCLELIALHALPPPSQAPSAPEAFRHMNSTVTQCWLGLDTDGKFRLFRGWSAGQPATGALLGTSPDAVELQPGTPFGTNHLFNNESSPYLRRYIADFTIGPSGGVTVWRENDDGDMEVFWALTGVNTQADGDWGSFAWSIGQRAPYSVLTHSYSSGPFPSDAGYYWRFQDVVIADAPLGKLRFHTLFPTGNGSQNDFPMVDPEEGLLSIDGIATEGTGDQSPYANANITIATGWTNPANVYGASDAAYATAAPSTNQTITTAFGFPAIDTSAIPDGSRITRIRSRYTYKTSVTGSTGSALRTQVDINGTATGTNLSDAFKSTTDVTRLSPSLSGITLADLRTANRVRLRIGAQRTSGAAITYSLDAVQLLIDFIPAASVRALTVRDDPLRDLTPSPDEAFTMVAQSSGSFNGETERFVFESLPALDTGESVAAVGLSVYASGQGGELVSGTYTPNQTAYGFRAALYPELASGALFLNGPSRHQFDLDESIFADSYVPNPDPSGSDQEGMGFYGFIPWQDFWPYRTGATGWTRDEVNALEGGVQTTQKAVFLSQVTLLVITAVPVGNAPTLTCGVNDPGGAVRLLFTDFDTLQALEIERATDALGTDAFIITPLTGIPGTSTHYDDYAIPPSTTWYYRVRYLGEMDWLTDWVSCTSNEPPCTGPPSNPYPTDPPPVAPVTPLIYIRTNLQWHGVPIDQLSRRANLASRQATEFTAIRANLAWRPVSGYDGETDPEPNTPLPPYHDPCFEYPEILPPGPVIPLTSRFYGLSNTPIGGLSADFMNGTQKALGGWYANDLPAAVARGAILVGAQGGGKEIKLNGDTWHLPTYLNGMRQKINPLYSLLSTYTASGGFFGVSAADDLASSSLWKPNGVPLNEFASAIATLKSEYPNLRFGCRFRPSQDTYDLGVDFYTAQYTAERGPAYAWASNEYSIAAGRSAFVIMSLNYLHGGNGSSGMRYENNTHKGQSGNNWIVSPAEVVSYLTAIFTACEDVDNTAAWLAGSLGYQHDPILFTISGMVDAMLTARNVLAGLPPL